MDQQEVFNKVVTHLSNQGEKAMFTDRHEEEICKYRLDNLKCAIGCLIQDEFYSPKLESHTVFSDLIKEALRKSGVDAGIDLFLLNRMQNIHDCSPIYRWPKDLKDLGKRYNLDVSLIDNLPWKEE